MTSRTVNIRHPDKLYIDGRWVAPAAGGHLQVISPTNDRVVAEVAEATAPDIDAAVTAARRAFDSSAWSRLSTPERAALIGKLATALEARTSELASAWVQQVGALAMAAPFMVGGAVAVAKYYATVGATFNFAEAVKPTDGRGTAIIAREPVGVVAAIAPWNAPLTIMLNKIVPALLAGCTVIMKPAPESPLDAYIVAEAAEAAGFPPGVVNLVPAHREASEALVRHPGVDKVSFTGSTAAGRRIAALCGERIARCTLELGGKSAAIVLDDYDIATAAKKLAHTISILSGQVCATLSRVVVPRAQQGAYAEALQAELAAIRVGDPTDPATMMGPLAMRRQLERVEGYMARGTAEGARLVCGGTRSKHMPQGCYFDPTLFTDVTSGMAIAQDEIFGPVIALLGYEDEADALRIANDSSYGLFGAVFTNDNDRAYRIARGVRTGALAQNDFRLDFFLPFGGFKQSGLGREGGITGLLGYTETKTILLQGAPTSL
jgi:acyl-CoA reductase-like NAD-dependent aldehyde dehydrogenase